MKILLENFHAKVVREDILKSKIGNESLHEISNDNGVVNFATSKNLTVKITKFPLRNIHKFTWTPPDGNTHSQIGYILIDMRRHSSILMFDRSGQKIFILTTIRWWEKLGRDCQ
jgi:hypothetical protein